MAPQDKYCRIVAHLKIQSGKLDAFKELCEQSVEKTGQEPKCLYHEFSFNGEQAYCLEAYADADALLSHVESAKSLLAEFWKISELTRLDIHGPEEEIAKLREPLATYNPQFYALKCGFRG